MGQPSTTKAPPPGIYRDEPERPSSSAVSLHSNIDFTREEGEEHDEALPPYSDLPTDDTSATPLNSTAYDHPPALFDAKVQEYYTTDAQGRRLVRISPVLTSDPIALKAYILEQSKQELQAQICVTGHHEETRQRNSKDKSDKKERVYDFSFYIDVTDTVSRRRSGRPCWSEFGVVGNDVKSYRGGRMKSRDKRFRADIGDTHQTATLDEWCHLFCASNSRLKTFALRRTITNRDEGALRQHITQLIRSTNYRGNIEITFPTDTRSVTIMSPHLLNRLRNNTFVWWACVLLQLWIFTWPVLLFMTKRWEVLQVEFPFKKLDKRTGQAEYVQCSEQDWCRRWAYTIKRGALMRAGAQGDKANLFYMDEAADSAERMRAEADFREAASQHGGFVGGAFGLLRTGFAAASEYRDGEQWGYDT